MQKNEGKRVAKFMRPSTFYRVSLANKDLAG